MEINFDNAIIKTSSSKSSDIKADSPRYLKNLKNDVFEKSSKASEKNVSFSGKRFLNNYGLQYSQSRVKDPSNYIKYSSGEIDKIHNNNSKKFASKLLPDVIKTLKADTLQSGKTVYDTMLEKGDELKNIPDLTYDYVNQRINTSLSEFSGKEIALIMLTKNEKNQPQEIINALNSLKENKPEEEYIEFVDKYVEKPDIDLINTIKKIVKPMDEITEAKIKNVQELLDKNSHQRLISDKKEKLRLAKRTNSENALSDLELGTYLTLSRAKNVPEMNKRLEKMKPHLPEEIYDSILKKCCTGEIDSDMLYDELFKIRANQTPFRDFVDDDDWTRFFIEKMQEIKANMQEIEASRKKHSTSF